jgi:hypothetical protein
MGFGASFFILNTDGTGGRRGGTVFFENQGARRKKYRTSARGAG